MIKPLYFIHYVIVLGTVEGYFKDGEDIILLNGSFILQQSHWLYKFTKHRSRSIEIFLSTWSWYYY